LHLELLPLVPIIPGLTPALGGFPSLLLTCLLIFGALQGVALDWLLHSDLANYLLVNAVIVLRCERK